MNNMATLINKLTPFELGARHARSDRPFYFPYNDAENNKQYRLGYNAELKRTTGVPKGKEQPLP